MNFVHGKSEECTKTEWDLFSVPPTQVSLEKGLWIDHQPVSSVSNGGPITFMRPGTEDCLDLSKTILVVHAKVTKANGNDVDAGEHVGIVNNFLHSLFKQVDVFLKEKQVTQATGTYAYRAYLETLLNYGPAAKESQFTDHNAISFDFTAFVKAPRKSVRTACLRLFERRSKWST